LAAKLPKPAQNNGFLTLPAAIPAAYSGNPGRAGNDQEMERWYFIL
jgi:hypothetical protein